MSGRESYKPGPAAGAEIRKDGDKWNLIVTQELRHPPATVWQACGNGPNCWAARCAPHRSRVAASP